MFDPALLDDLNRQRQSGGRLRLLSVRQAAEMLGLSVSTLNKMRLSGSGPCYTKLGRRVLYDIRDIELWVQQRKRSHTSE